ncbi:MAG: hypothetical protein ABEI80_06460, partial [Haloplanus sp.]
ESAERFRDEPPRFAIKRSGQELAEGVLRRVPGPSGDPIWERDWDVLVILDACRYDVFEDRYAGAEWLDSLEPTMSVGSASPEWMDNTFTSAYRDEMQSTAYVTGNPYSENHVPAEELGLLDEVWRYVWDDELGTIPPEPLTNQVVKHYRSGAYDRLIVHYMQPHWPYVTDPIMYGFDPEHITGSGSTTNPFDRQNRGELSRDAHLDRYRSNLEYVVDHVRETLLTAIDADTVALTADHATLFGDYGLYKHPSRVPLPVLRRVPWAITSATNAGGFDPENIEDDATELGVDREAQLRDLGYL